ncbi:MAG TPA: PDZ domain-containing protein [bacterium]|nr:PDZ domain-containing protein [bacterium]
MGSRSVLSRLALTLVLLVVAVGIGGAAYAADAGWLGVMLQPLTDDLRGAMNVGKDVEGVLVSDVVAGSPAEAAGFAKGDVIVEIEGNTITTAEQAISQIKSHAPGDKVKIVAIRAGKREVMTATLGTREAAEEATPESKEYYNIKIPRVERIFKEFKPEPGGYLGAKVQDISDDLGQYFGVHEGEGVLVLDVMADTPAERAGLKAGDVITKVDGQDVSDSGELVGYLRQHDPGDKVDVTFKRNRETRRVEVELDKAPNAAHIFMKQLGQPCAPGQAGETEEEMMQPPCTGAAPEMQMKMMERMPKTPEAMEMRREMDEMKAEIDQLKQEIESLKK